MKKGLAALLLVAVMLPGMGIAVIAEEPLRPAPAPLPADFSYNFVRQLTSARYSSSGQHLAIALQPATLPGDGEHDTLIIELWREGWMDDYLGSREFNRYRAETEKWEDVGPGTYFFIMGKVPDGQRVRGRGRIESR